MEIYNFLQVSDAIATAGQPTAQQFADIKAAGYEVVVNLALPASTNAITNEQKIVEDLGMDYVHIPVIWEKPTLEDIERFFNVMQANTNKKVFVHCAMNMRVSAFMYLYRVIHEQTSVEEAKQDLQRIWQPNDTWQQFIDKVIAHYQKA
ncbi:protein tyrosine phosphatase family protein [Chroogloeocystis siderophila]|jgi:protein tyrosine phosphatase (PTP) superfamily phosphohydrolase (DUF442 family)|uniref:Phosphatase n=1 Tax=Chroogloeocystis siderophila 5.2 s.c.1 TaxID=247279 RepID=A0A1U7HC59_9CHRO|nr:protein tyrosine phosphatase family protein [Chroogloeocystis siderophila]OKH21159.1 phosphatase [Chroogloeocystis siderophila 5.2 s.c.1]